jgi:hypothetical protein
VASAAVAGFPLPVLRYVVGNAAAADAGSTTDERAGARLRRLSLLVPSANAPVPPGRWTFGWMPMSDAAQYRVEIGTRDGAPVFEALVPGESAAYAPPPFFAARANGAPLRWRVRAFDLVGREVGRSPWRELTLR